MYLYLAMPLGGLLKNFMGDVPHPPEKSEQAMVSESLMMELDFQMQEAEQLMKQQKQQERKQATGVDYTWLMTPTTKGYEMSQVERMEIEELCMKVKPSECGKVINMFRDSLLRQPSVEEIPRCLRAVVTQVLDTRPEEDTTTMPEWLTKSFKNLRPSSRVTPVNTVSGSLQSNSRVSSVYSSSPMPDEDFVSYTSVENLPV
jgi:hypothetical protein